MKTKSLLALLGEDLDRLNRSLSGALRQSIALRHGMQLGHRLGLAAARAESHSASASENESDRFHKREVDYSADH